jgi:organic radical activating enzyme
MLRLTRLTSGEPELFATIQGEGVSAGVPSVFVRLAVCNLQCAYCDTPFSWDWTRYDPKVEIVDLEVADVARRVEAAGPRNVVLTGGEPLLQQRALVPLATALKAGGRRIEVETNGTIQPHTGLVALIDQWNVSPKLANSGNAPRARERAAPLRWFAAQPNAYFKLVVATPEDLGEATALVERYGVPRERVLLMPEGTSAQALAERSPWLAERCAELGYRFTTRLHILLWGDERGR